MILKIKIFIQEIFKRNFPLQRFIPRDRFIS